MGDVKRPYRGRPEKCTERVELRVTPSHRTALDRIANEQDRSLSAIFKRLIDQLVKDNPAPTP